MENSEELKALNETLKETNDILGAILNEMHLNTLMKFEKERFDHLSDEEKEDSYKWWKLDGVEKERLYQPGGLGDFKCAVGDSLRRLYDNYNRL